MTKISHGNGLRKAHLDSCEAKNGAYIDFRRVGYLLMSDKGSQAGVLKGVGVPWCYWHPLLFTRLSEI